MIVEIQQIGNWVRNQPLTAKMLCLVSTLLMAVSCSRVDDRLEPSTRNGTLAKMSGWIYPLEYLKAENLAKCRDIRDVKAMLLKFDGRFHQSEFDKISVDDYGRPMRFRVLPPGCLEVWSAGPDGQFDPSGEDDMTLTICLTKDSYTTKWYGRGTGVGYLFQDYP